MDILWIAIAFIFGLAARQVNLPPLVGFLLAGFILHQMGGRAGEDLHLFAEFGVTLLLFSIGLKLKLETLFKPQVWAVASLHLGATVLLFTVILLLLPLTGFALFQTLNFTTALLIAFALSFSSTVFAVKILEAKGEMGAIYARTAIGILIMQDIAAVLFLATSTGKIPSPWALALLALIPLRPLFGKLLERSGHDELLILFGLTVALGGAELFESLQLKGDLGALLLGLLLSNHPKSSELARTLLGFKDLLLVGFFLSIGLEYGPPNLAALGVALFFVLLIPLKVWLYFWLLVRLQLRSRTAFLASLSLANYSEFGLIVAAIGVKYGWLTGEWLVILAVALSIIFILASPVNTSAHLLYARYRSWLKQFEVPERLPEEAMIDARDASILIFGMGRVGASAYEVMQQHFGSGVFGIDLDPIKVNKHQEAGRQVIRESATDPDFWNRLHIDKDKVRLVMLAMPSQQENLFAIEQLIASGYSGRIAATAKYQDDVEALKTAGADAAFNLYAEAGIGFADHVCAVLGECTIAGNASN